MEEEEGEEEEEEVVPSDGFSLESLVFFPT